MYADMVDKGAFDQRLGANAESEDDLYCSGSLGTTADRAKLHPSGLTDMYLRGSPVFRRHRARSLGRCPIRCVVTIRNVDLEGSSLAGDSMERTACVGHL